jgi:putative hydrolase of the HAD superfamily
VEPELLALFGMGPFRMEPSFRGTYLRLCARHRLPPDPRVAEECAALGREFLGHPRVLENSLEALQRLAASVPTVLFSQASHAEYQLGRIRAAGVAGILGEARVRITPRKTPETYREALDHFGVRDPARATMIGNSVRSDINPALVSGSEAILVEPYPMWQYDNVPPVSGAFLRFPSFQEAVAHLVGDDA